MLLIPGEFAENATWIATGLHGLPDLQQLVPVLCDPIQDRAVVFRVECPGEALRLVD